ncbi:MAG: ice-binding family protein [Candidatus Buchananbacteria bacterium]
MNLIHKISIALFAIAFGVAFYGPLAALAATAPTLGDAASFAVLGFTTVTNTGNSVLNGDLGLYSGSSITGFLGTTANEGPGVVSAGYAVYQTTALAQTAQTAATAAYSTMAGQSAGCTDLSGQNLGGKILTPGVYCFSAAAQLTGTLTLDAQNDPNAVWIFQVGSALTIDNSASIVFINGGTGTPGCNVFWQVYSAATIGTSATMVGTIIADTEAITLNTSSTLYGRAISRAAAVTLGANTITVPTCVAAAAVTASSAQPATINVVKTVINDNGRTKTVADFPLFVNGVAVVSGVTNTFPAPGVANTVTETNDPNYTRTFSGDCDVNGQFNLNPGDNKFCILTNNDIGAPVVVPPVPPLIDVVKTANPLSLPAGPGPVTYTYTLRNIGIVPVSDVTMVGDSCSPIILKSGDINNDSKLDLAETWVYTCSRSLTATHTNTVVATGWANGISAVDIASATVVVGLPIVPPLIHVVKVPSPLTLPAKGGAVTYTYTVTNPGTEPLNNVTITDDKCTGLPGRVIGHPGDINKNNLLESNESWIFTCKSKLTQTTVNTVTATGQANGLTAKDLALATVVVAAPSLPNTGIAPETSQNVLIFIGLSITALISAFVFLRKLAA